MESGMLQFLDIWMWISSLNVMLRMNENMKNMCVCVRFYMCSVFMKRLHYQTDIGIALSDILHLLPQWAVHLTLLAVHTLITFLLPVPGCPT